MQDLIPRLETLLYSFRDAAFPIFHTREGEQPIFFCADIQWRLGDITRTCPHFPVKNISDHETAKSTSVLAIMALSAASSFAVSLVIILIVAALCPNQMS